MYFFRELLNQNRSVHNAFDDKSLLKLIFTTRPERCTVALGTPTCCQLQPSSHSLCGLSPTRRWVGTRALGTRLLSFFFTFGKGKVRVHFSTQLIMKCPSLYQQGWLSMRSSWLGQKQVSFLSALRKCKGFPARDKNKPSVITRCPY